MILVHCVIVDEKSAISVVMSAMKQIGCVWLFSGKVILHLSSVPTCTFPFRKSCLVCSRVKSVVSSPLVLKVLPLMLYISSVDLLSSLSFFFFLVLKRDIL